MARLVALFTSSTTTIPGVKGKLAALISASWPARAKPASLFWMKVPVCGLLLAAVSAILANITGSAWMITVPNETT